MKNDKKELTLTERMAEFKDYPKPKKSINTKRINWIINIVENIVKEESK
jgi:hypothetical protein